MKGLFIKDLCLMAKRKTYFLLVLVICVAVTYVNNPQFVFGYMTIILSLFTTSSVSYDEFDNCYPYLMSLPITRKEYVKEKYLYGLALSGCGWIASAILYIIICLVKGLQVNIVEDLVCSLMYIPFAMIVISFYLPVILKYGSDKSRTVMLVIYGVIAVMIMVASGLTSVPFVSNINNLEGINDFAVTGIIGALGLIVGIISIKVSTGIMENKEF